MMLKRRRTALLLASCLLLPAAPANLRASTGGVRDTGTLNTQGQLTAGQSAPAAPGSGRQVFNVKAYGAKGDARDVSGAASTSASTTISSASLSLTSADVGKKFVMQGAGASGAPLTGTISAVLSATSFTSSAAAGVTASDKNLTYGTDDTSAIQAAITAAQAVLGTALLPVPSNAYLVTSALSITAPIQFRGEGSHNRNNFTFDGSGNFTVNYNAAPTGNCLRWAGGAAGMMNVTNVINLAMENLCLDGANLATYGVKFDRLNQSSVRDISVLRVTGGSNGIAMLLGSSEDLHNGSGKNVLTNIYLQGDSALYLGPFDGGTSGAFLNIIINLYAEHTGADNATHYGIYMAGGDNNHFHNTLSLNHADPTKDRDLWFAASGTRGSTWNANKAYNNYFWGITLTKIYLESDSPYTGKVVLDAANTSIPVTVPSGSALDFEVNGFSNISGGKVMRYYGTGEFMRGLVNRGGFSNALQIISATATLNPTAGYRVAVTGTFTLTISASASVPGYENCITNYGSGTVTLARTGADVFQGRGAAGATSFSLTAGNSVCIAADGGTTWFLF